MIDGLGRGLLLAAAILALPSTSGRAAETGNAPTEIRLGLVAFEDFQPEFDRTKKLLGELKLPGDARVTFRLAVGTYGDVAHWLKTGQIDVAVVTPGLLAEFLGDGPLDAGNPLPIEYLASVSKPRATSPWAAADRRSAPWSETYRAVCVVARDTAIHTVDDLRHALEGGGRVLAVHPASVSSRLAPAAALASVGIGLSPGQIEYTHSHTASLRLVAAARAGKPAIAFVWDDALRTAPELESQLRVVAVPALDAMAIPTDAIIARNGLPLAEVLREALRDHVDEQGDHDFSAADDWQARYALVRRWLGSSSADEEAQRISLDEIGRLLVHHARSQPAPPRLAVVLSGGGAKCSYQVGAVAAVENQLEQVRRENPGLDLDINLVVGTSGGAINAVPIALGVTRSEAGRRDFLDVWTKLDQRKIVRPAQIVRGNIGLWFALAQTALVLWLIRRYVPAPDRRGWVFGGIFAGLAAFEIVLRYLDLAPWSMLGPNHWLHHAWLWMSFGIGASAWSVLLLGLGTLALQWRAVRRGSYLHISTRRAGGLLAGALLALPLIQVVTVVFFQQTLSGGEGIEQALADHFPALIDRYLEREALKPLGANAGRTAALELKSASRQISERRLLARDLVLTGSCLEQSTADLPSDLYFHARGRLKSPSADPPFGPRGISMDEHAGILLDVVMGSGSIFPVFPSRRLEDFPRAGEFVELVDGGFAHNSPIEAAVLWGATHVILIEASPRERAQRENFLQNAAASFDHLYEQSQLLDTRSRGKVAVFTLSPRSPHLCVLDFADNLIRASAERGHRDATGSGADRARFRKEPGEPTFTTVERGGS